MIRNRSVRRSPKARALRAVAYSSTAAIGTVTLAGGASAAVLFLTLLSSALGVNGSLFKWLQPLATAASFGIVGAAKPVTPTPAPASTSVTVVQPGAKSAGGAAIDTSGTRKTKLGVNLEMPTYYGNARIFSNLILQSPWWLDTPTGWVYLPADRLDGNQNLTKLEANEKAIRVIAPSTKALKGLSVDIVCRWSGKATIRLNGPLVRNPRISANSLTFTFMPQGSQGAQFMISNFNAADPVRDIDCRETDADPQAVFDPTFLEEVGRYDTLRFMKWQKAVEANTAISWAGRSRPTSNSYNATTDGVSIEHMVLLANLTRTNPWFCIPWNADEEYIRKFAEYVREHLDPSLVAYVELSNEVWNWGYKVTTQARDEGKTRNLSTNDGLAVLYRYAQRTGEVMDVWKSVFASNPERIVRVIATQNTVPWGAKMALNFQDTSSKVDALATAPYFAWNFAKGATVPADFFSTILADKVDLAMKSAAENKALADEKGLRFITYEAGQHVTIASADDVPLLTQVERDPRMGELYTRYLTKWRNEIGDLMVLFHAWGPTNQHGGWGMQEYLGQPLNEAPKAQAVDLFRRSYVTKN